MAFTQIILNVNQIVQCGIFRARYQFKGYRLHLVKVQTIVEAPTFCQICHIGHTLFITSSIKCRMKMDLCIS